MKALIRAKIDEKGLSMSGLSKDVLKKNHAYLQQFLERGVPQKLPEDTRALLAGALGVSEHELRDPVNRDTKMHGTSHPVPVQPSFAGHVKVLGMAECGPDGWALWNGEVVDSVPRPPSLAGARNGYAVFAVGSSMEPRYYAGELIYIHPDKPITPGCFVLVQMVPKEDGLAPRAVLKRLVRRSGSKVVLEQFAPEKTFEIKASEVVSMHRAVGSGEA